jgi:hypothetical protein
LGGLVILLNQAAVHHQAMLVHDRLQRVDDSFFLLHAVLDLLHRDGMDLAHHGFEELHEHPVAEVGLNQYPVDLLPLGNLAQFCQRLVRVAAQKSAAFQQEQLAIQDFDHGIRGFGLSPPGRVNGHHRSGIGNPLPWMAMSR